MEDLAYRPMEKTEADLALFSEAFRRNQSPKSVQLLRWQYFDNPAAGLYVDFAIDEAKGRIAAIYAMQPVQVRVAGRIARAAISLNTLTDRDYRRRGLFVKLATRVYERARGDGLAFVYGFPNRTSAHGFWTHLGWRSFGAIRQLVKPLSMEYYIRRVKPARSLLRPQSRASCTPLPSNADRQDGIRQLVSFGPETDELWTESSQRIGVALDRNHAFMNWRFTRKPDERYYVEGSYVGGRIDALVVYKIKGQWEGRVGLIVELLHLTTAADGALCLLKSTLAKLKRCGCYAAYSWCLPGSPCFSVYRRAGFAINSGLHNRGVYLGVGSLVASERSLLTDRENWFISGADIDTV